jgi:hypothetical protein
MVHKPMPTWEGNVRSSHQTMLQVPGAEVMVYRIRDPVSGDNGEYEDGILEAPVASPEVTPAFTAEHAQPQPCIGTGKD